jgi:uncharacterized protein (TIGR02996 family)
LQNEKAFLQAIAHDPQDEAPRLIYADWLEERGDPRAEYLRVEVAMARLSKTGRKYRALAKRLRELQVGLDRQWLAWVDRTAAVRSCRFRFEFECPLRWENLKPTGRATVRFCEACRQKVYHCQSLREVFRRARQGKCVAVDEEVFRFPPGAATSHPPVRMGRMLPQR